MLDSVYGKRRQDALNLLIASAKDITAAYGLDPALAANVQTVKGNNDRIRHLSQLEAVAALMAAVNEAAAGGAPESSGDWVSLADILAIEGLTKSSKAAILAAYGQEEGG